MAVWTTNARTRKSPRLPKRSPMRAAPASGTARNSASSQNPAWNELAMADSHGAWVASTSGWSSASDGDHHPKYFVAMKYSITS
jgi:hypothetical protein